MDNEAGNTKKDPCDDLRTHIEFLKNLNDKLLLLLEKALSNKQDDS